MCLELVSSFDVLGIDLFSEDQGVLSEQIGADISVYKHIATLSGSVRFCTPPGKLEKYSGFFPRLPGGECDLGVVHLTFFDKIFRTLCN